MEIKYNPETHQFDVAFAGDDTRHFASWTGAQEAIEAFRKAQAKVSLKKAAIPVLNELGRASTAVSVHLGHGNIRFNPTFDHTYRVYVDRPDVRALLTRKAALVAEIEQITQQVKPFILRASCDSHGGQEAIAQRWTEWIAQAEALIAMPAAQ